MEVWMLCDEKGSWSFSFDPPTKKAQKYWRAKGRKIVHLREAIEPVETYWFVEKPYPSGIGWGYDRVLMSKRHAIRLARRTRKFGEPCRAVRQETYVEDG